MNLSTSYELVKRLDGYVLPQQVVLPEDTQLLARSTMPVGQRAGAAFIIKIDAIETSHDGPIRQLLEGAGSHETFREASTRFQAELIKILDGMSKAFSAVQGGEKAEGEHCLLDTQCATGLYCRNDSALEFKCLPKGEAGEHCWTSNQCVSGTSCRWVAQTSGGFFGKIPHPARVCD